MKTVQFIMSLLFLALLFELNAQNYYQPGILYDFRSRSPLDSNKTSVLAIEFDSQGKAYLSRSTGNYVSGDIQKSYVMAPSEEVVTDYLGFEISGNTDNYWVIPINGSETAQNLSGGGEKVELWCECTKGDGTCSVSYMTSRTTLNATCVANAGCWDCVMKAKVVKRGVVIGPHVGGIVLLKATSVEWR
jgi:hypothetical protein